MRSENGYWLVTSHDAMNRPEIAAFKDWLVAETQAFEVPGAPSRSARIGELVAGLVDAGR